MATNKLLDEIERLKRMEGEWYSYLGSRDERDMDRIESRLDQCKKDIALFKEMLNDLERFMTDKDGYIKLESDAIIKYLREYLDEALEERGT